MVLFSLERRQIRGGMIEMHGVDKVNKGKLFSPPPDTRIRGHPMKWNLGRVKAD